MQNPTMNEMAQGFRDAYAAQSERMVTVGRQLTDWQIAQLKAVESGMTTAMHMSFVAMEQAMAAGFEMNRMMLGAFAPQKAEDKAQA